MDDSALVKASGKFIAVVDFMVKVGLGTVVAVAVARSMGVEI